MWPRHPEASTAALSLLGPAAPPPSDALARLRPESWPHHRALPPSRPSLPVGRNLTSPPASRDAARPVSRSLSSSPDLSPRPRLLPLLAGAARAPPPCPAFGARAHAAGDLCTARDLASRRTGGIRRRCSRL